MELEIMFSDQKWNILRSLSENKLSPMQLAGKLNTTMANISQQLRLLEAANLVKKEKIKNRERGKPRTLFSLRRDSAYIIPTMNNFAEKKLLRATDHHRMMLRIWFIEDSELHPKIEKLCWKMEPKIEKIESILFDQSNKELIIISDHKGQIENLAKSNDFGVRVLSSSEAKLTIADSLDLVKIYRKNNNLLKTSKEVRN